MARSELPVHPLINERYSPRAFSERDITNDELVLLFEAARWAPSSLNEQPWRFVIVRKGEKGHSAMLEAMNVSNRTWADKAPVVLLSLTRITLERSGIPNPHARHDLGLAVAQLTVQATSLGIGLHQLGGIDAEKARNSFNVPPEYDVVSMLVLGFHGDPADLPELLRDRELRRSTRKPLDDLLHYGSFGQEHKSR
ncbi:MAG: nitroreductase family protein [Bacteroidota bacterium]|nr:nitroreductase family protein [Bacteroidota bacterium]